MGLRSRGKLLILMTVFGSFSLLLLQSRSGEMGSTFQSKESRLEELWNRLQSTERQNQARAVELHHLQQQLRRVAEVTGNGSSPRDEHQNHLLSQLNTQNLNTSNFLHLPSVLEYMPHLKTNPVGLQPAYQLSQGNTGVSIVIGVPTIKRDVQSYLMETLHSLVSGLSQEEKLECLIVVFIAEADRDYVVKEAAGIQKECLCNGGCTPMPTVRESVCCKELQRILEKMEAYTEEELGCITSHPGFPSVCLDRWVLETAHYQYVQQYGGRARRDPSENEKSRHTAYRQLVRWCWQFLGRRVRVPLPSCAVTMIRNTFPSEVYKGFEDIYM